MERERLEVDVLFVGAGPACLAGALHLARRIQEHNRSIDSGDQGGQKVPEQTILVIEKGQEVGSHGLSGAVVDPSAFEKLLGGLDVGRPPYDCKVKDDALYILTKNKSFRSPITPPPLKNHGYFIASLGQLVRWMAEVCEAQGVEVYPGFPAARLLTENGKVIGARMADQGRGADGEPKPNFVPGIDVLAKVTVLGEGPRGTLTGQAARRFQLYQGKQPQIYSIGVKEIWEVRGELSPGTVFHTLGYPLGTEEFGGGFIYAMRDNLLSVGFVVGLDYRDPALDGHHLLQQFKTHPFVASLLREGKPIEYGAKAIPEGGYYAMPKMYGDGFLIVGDSAGFLNAQRLKGIHLAIDSGMMAADTIFEGLIKEDFGQSTLAAYEQRFEKSQARDELYRVRNFRQAFQSGFWSGFFHAGLQFISGGRGLKDPFPIQAGHERMQKLEESERRAEQKSEIDFDGKLTLDKLSDVYLSDTAHEENQPSHLKILEPDICDVRCTQEYGNPCQYFCPASVYEILEDFAQDRLRINFSNCVHCKTCEIMDPYQVILWTVPEGGGGPDWKKM